jgi:hypothetical protein
MITTNEKSINSHLDHLIGSIQGPVDSPYEGNKKCILLRLSDS